MQNSGLGAALAKERFAQMPLAAPALRDFGDVSFRHRQPAGGRLALAADPTGATFSRRNGEPGPSTAILINRFRKPEA